MFDFIKKVIGFFGWRPPKGEPTAPGRPGNGARPNPEPRPIPTGRIDPNELVQHDLNIDWDGFDRLCRQALAGLSGDLAAQQAALFKATRNHVPDRYVRLDSGRKYPHAEPRVEFCGYDDNDGVAQIIPVFVVDNAPVEGSGRNLLYFVEGAFCFHPGSLPEFGGSDVRLAPTSAATGALVTTVDTGRVGDTRSLNFFGGGADPVDDVVTGHGPAIADMIGDLIGSDPGANDDHVESALVDVALGDGTHWAVPVNDAAGDQVEFVGPTGGGRPAWVRCFDTHALLAALERVPPETKVLNLSLSASACPADMAHDAVLDWIERWIGSGRQGRYVAAAAGNHGTTAPVWPAAASEPDWSAHQGPVLGASLSGGIVSVGSGERGQAPPDDFSGRGHWVFTQRPGVERPVKAPSPGTTWTGTSFSTPQVAVDLRTAPDKGQVQ